MYMQMYIQLGVADSPQSTCAPCATLYESLDMWHTRHTCTIVCVCDIRATLDMHV